MADCFGSGDVIFPAVCVKFFCRFIIKTDFQVIPLWVLCFRSSCSWSHALTSLSVFHNIIILSVLQKVNTFRKDFSKKIPPCKLTGNTLTTAWHCAILSFVRAAVECLFSVCTLSAAFHVCHHSTLFLRPDGGSGGGAPPKAVGICLPVHLSPVCRYDP